MLTPLTAMLVRIGAMTEQPATSVTPVTPVPESNTQHVPQWASVREMAEQADLKDLTYALAVYLNRIGEELE